MTKYDLHDPRHHCFYDVYFPGAPDDRQYVNCYLNIGHTTYKIKLEKCDNFSIGFDEGMFPNDK